MEKSFTLRDLQYYLLEIKLIEKSTSNEMQHASGPGRQVIQNLLCYSGALNVLKTSNVGNIFQLTN